ncbi:hypothetical protein MS3_00000728 [Schistosoma haematobium]|uniref:Peptidase A2 domain-containing protein n=1 Tax=Schistosoma haematobium TaxID=6185 RepID=A0A922IKA5_SCHHA|nr:hypothetical protein MS3_00000728 [Schistosoma haematobium]KAH9580789.1 hypothetical protein MS3_00000728 [Schistosoma haematobium]
MVFVEKKPCSSRGASEPTPRFNTNSLSLILSCKNSTPVERKFITLSINGRPFRLRIDSASDVTILSRTYWIRMERPCTVPTTHKPRNSWGNYLRLLGQPDCKVSFHDPTFTGVPYITPVYINLLGLNWFDRLHLTDVPLSTVCHLVKQPHEPEVYSKELMVEFSTIFQPVLGQRIAMKATLRLKRGAKPVFRPKRPVLYAALSKADEELNRLQLQRVITPVSYSAPIVVIKKVNGTIRICADFSIGLNAALEQHHCPLPVTSDVYDVKW